MAVHSPFDQIARLADQSGNTPAAGTVGERLVAVMSAQLGSGFTTTQWGNLNSLVLTPGSWLVIGEFFTIIGGTITNAQHALSLFTGNTTTDHVAGDNVGPAFGSLLACGYTIAWPVNTPGGTTVFAKTNLTGVSLANVAQAKISAYRVR